MVVGDRGYRKIIYLKGYSAAYLDGLTKVQLRVQRPDGSTFVRDLLPADRDASKNFTWLIEDGDLSMPGCYLFQAIGITGTQQAATCRIKVHVCELI